LHECFLLFWILRTDTGSDFDFIKRLDKSTYKITLNNYFNKAYLKKLFESHTNLMSTFAWYFFLLKTKTPRQSGAFFNKRV